MVEPSDAVDELARLLDSGPAPIDRSLLLLSEALQRTPGVVKSGLERIDAIAEDVVSSSAGTPQVANLVQTLFVQHCFAGDVQDYHGEENSFLDRVLERRIGMPITLSAVVVAVGQRVGLPLNLIGLPGHVVVGTHDKDKGFGSFIDAFSGSEVNRSALAQRLQSIFAREVEVSDSLLVAMSTNDVVSRVCNNLTRSWITQPLKLNRLIDVRSKLPQSNQDRIALAHLAEAQSRFDVAARLRELVNPEDPTVNQLWARLN